MCDEMTTERLAAIEAEHARNDVTIGFAAPGFMVNAWEREMALVAEVRRLHRMTESAAPWHVSDPPTDEEMRALRLRWASGPERYQADADALISAVIHERARSRAATQAIIAAIGSKGPESIEEAAARVVAEVERLRAAVEGVPSPGGDECSGAALGRPVHDRLVVAEDLRRIAYEQRNASDERHVRAVEARDEVLNLLRDVALALGCTVSSLLESADAIEAAAPRLRAIETAAREYLAAESAWLAEVTNARNARALESVFNAAREKLAGLVNP